MTNWRVIPADRRTAFSGVAIELLDEFTGAQAIGTFNLTMDFQVGADWRETTIKPNRNASGIFVYTGLGKTFDPAAAPTFRVRVRIDAQYYRPGFQATDAGLEFDVPTYNDAVPPILTPLIPETVMMWPRANYPFAAHIRTIKGRVRNAGGDAMANAQLAADGVERVMTDESGAYTLPLRWQAQTTAVNVGVTHLRSGLSASRVFNLPADLSGNQDITIT